MKKVLLMTLALMVCASAAMADHVGTYSDQSGTSCVLTTLAPPPTNNSVYIIQKFNANGATAIQFKVNDATSGLFFANATYNAAFLVLGTPQTDLSIAYTSCLVGDVLCATLNYFWFGAPITGCGATVGVGPAPTSPIPGEIATVECDLATVTALTGGQLWVGPGAGDCPGGPCDPLAAQENTWGGVKALYR